MSIIDENTSKKGEKMNQILVEICTNVGDFTFIYKDDIVTKFQLKNFFADCATKKIKVLGVSQKKLTKEIINKILLINEEAISHGNH
jgi:hypothetical protein